MADDDGPGVVAFTEVIGLSSRGALPVLKAVGSSGGRGPAKTWILRACPLRARTEEP
jgi:hypothetical protein